MKKVITIILFLFPHLVSAQDEIILRSTLTVTEYELKIQSITNDSIFFMAFWKNGTLPLKEILSYRKNYKKGGAYVFPDSIDNHKYFIKNGVAVLREEILAEQKQKELEIKERQLKRDSIKQMEERQRLIEKQAIRKRMKYRKEKISCFLNYDRPFFIQSDSIQKKWISMFGGGFNYLIPIKYYSYPNRTVYYSEGINIGYKKFNIKRKFNCKTAIYYKPFYFNEKFLNSLAIDFGVEKRMFMTKKTEFNLGIATFYAGYFSVFKRINRSAYLNSYLSLPGVGPTLSINYRVSKKIALSFDTFFCFTYAKKSHYYDSDYRLMIDVPKFFGLHLYYRLK